MYTYSYYIYIYIIYIYIYIYIYKQLTFMHYKETILRINEQNIALTSENSSLKTDLERFLEKSKG